MLVALRCPNPVCRAPLDDSTVVVDKGHCPYCDTYFEGTGGTLAFTSNYRLDLPDLSQSRVEADLTVFRNYEALCRGKLEDCKQKLEWSVEQYASLPQPPELLELQDAPAAWKWFGFSILLAPVGFVAGLIISVIIFVILLIPIHLFGWPFSSENEANSFLTHFVWAWPVASVLIGLINLLRVIIGNGSKPSENARRQVEYEDAREGALRAARPLKEAEDYRLIVEIRNLEAKIKAVREKADSVGRLRVTRRR